MRIFINGEAMQASLYDDETALLSRYARMVKTDPRYLRFAEEFSIRKGGKYDVEDIRTVVGDLTINDLYDESVLMGLRLQYPRLSRSDIILLWLMEKFTPEEIRGMNKEEFKSIQSLDPRSFPNQTKTAKRMQEYPKQLEERIEKESEVEKSRGKIMKKLSKVREVKTDEFSLEEVTVSYILDVPRGTSLEDIFDSMDASQDVPFIFLSHNGKTWYKIYSKMIPLDDWLIEDYEDGLHFKIFNAPHTKLSSRIKEKNLYSDGRWITSNNVEIAINIRSQVGEEGIRQRFEASLGDLDYKFAASKQIALRGTFIVPDFIFNKAIMAYLIDNDPVMKYFLFLQEVKKSAIDKRDFYFFYHPNQRGFPDESLKLTLTSHEEAGEWTTVRVAKATNQQQVEILQRVFSKLMGVYLAEQSQVDNLYRTIVPGASKILADYSVKRRKKAKNKKTGARLQRLQMQRPDLFMAGYSSRCSPIDKQPYLLNPSKVDEFIDKYGDHALLKFPGTEDHYACVPREKSDTIRKYKYPGLKLNTNPKNKDEFKYIPCCYEVDQYEKTSSELYKYLNPEEEKALPKIEQSYIYGPKRVLFGNRLGEVPYYLKYVFMAAGYQEEERGNRVTIPVLRLGVMKSPDSFIHCLEKALNPRYSSMDIKEQKARVDEVRRDMTRLDYEVAKQQLYDYSDEEIRAALLDFGSYMDPDRWIRLAETQYNCNIFLFQTDSEHPNGSIVIPRASQAYLPTKLARRRTVLIIKMGVAEDYPYQCELLVEFNPEGPIQQQFVYSYGREHRTLIRTVKKFTAMTNEVNVVQLTPKTGYMHYK